MSNRIDFNLTSRFPLSLASHVTQFTTILNKSGKSPLNSDAAVKPPASHQDNWFSLSNAAKATGAALLLASAAALAWRSGKVRNIVRIIRSDLMKDVGNLRGWVGRTAEEIGVGAGLAMRGGLNPGFIEGAGSWISRGRKTRPGLLETLQNKFAKVKDEAGKAFKAFQEVVSKSTSLSDDVISAYKEAVREEIRRTRDRTRALAKQLGSAKLEGKQLRTQDDVDYINFQCLYRRGALRAEKYLKEFEKKGKRSQEVVLETVRKYKEPLKKIVEEGDPILKNALRKTWAQNWLTKLEDLERRALAMKG